MSEDKKRYRIEEKPDMTDWNNTRARTRIFKKSQKKSGDPDDA